MNSPKAYSWEELENRRAQLRQEVKEKEQTVREKMNKIFVAPTNEDKLSMAYNYAKAGISVYDGFMTGFKLLKSLGLFFKKKKKK